MRLLASRAPVGWKPAVILLASTVLLAGALASGCTCRPEHSAAGDAGIAGTNQSGTGEGGESDITAQTIVISGIALKVVDPIDDVTGVQSEGPELYPRELAQRLGMDLTGSDQFARSVAEVESSRRARLATLEVRIHYDTLATGSLGGPSLVVAVEGALAWDDEVRTDPLPWHSLIVERPLSEAGDAGARAGGDAAGTTANDGQVATLVAEAVSELGRVLIARETVRTGGEDALQRALQSSRDDIAAVLWALDLVAYRGRIIHLDAVLKALATTSDDTVRLKAIEVATALLVSAGPEVRQDSSRQRTVRVIADSARFEDPELVGAAIDALVALGGDEARSFLEFTATGHPHTALRERAAAGLRQLQSP